MTILIWYLGINMEILNSYSFQIVAIGTVLLGIVAALVGNINLQLGQSLIGDAMGHSTLVGVIAAYILLSTRDPLVLLLGAIISASISYLLIEYSKNNTKIGADANMAIFLSGFFGLGMVLKSYIQGNQNFEGASQAGLNNYIFGQAAYLMVEDIYLIAIVLSVCLAIILLFYKELKTYIFDKEFAVIINIPIKILDFLVLFMTILVIAVGIKAVGVILISSLLILPCVSANQWSNKFSNIMILSSIFSAVSSFIGTLISSLYTGFSTGPVIIIISGIILSISLLFGRNGVIRKRGRS